MVERYFGYREFARIAGISPQRLSELIKQGIVRTNEGGMVPESEIGYFIRERLGKELASSGHSYLYLLVGKPDEDEYRKALSSVVSCEGSTTISGKGVISAPLVSMDASFKSIVVSLNLIDEGREPLVLRSDWNPEASHSDKYFPDYFR